MHHVSVPSDLTQLDLLNLLLVILTAYFVPPGRYKVYFALALIDLQNHASQIHPLEQTNVG
ncbi:hypothetical protein ANCDUO_00065 [Ancylostoma duodenale]|uniref:Uncharacterized protein n=1 Tax=Ancylostoma duodenale TaxID=51022 RepID=A0A0C2HJ22_9BILA|nr:hypothetical protein ANCDUO_00065 [Ancylostoma duodenale]